MTTKPIININDIELQPRPPAYAAKGEAADRFDAKTGFIGPKIGATKLGYNITAVPPGKRAFPFHNHQVNEEMFFILNGAGELRFGKETYPVKQGDFICCPAGGPDVAHQLINTGSEELRYLAVSTKMNPEIVDYPDTGRFGIMAFLAAEDGAKPRNLMFVGDENESLDYWEGQ
jgi:uncharacterized cupin superfamily protein